VPFFDVDASLSPTDDDSFVDASPSPELAIDAPPVSPFPTKTLISPSLPAAVTALCSEDPSCPWLADDYCDDGGPGSQYDSCTYGGDCTDCGARAAMPLSPPSPPPPKLAVDGSLFCNNTCIYSDDGSCDDGGEGSAHSYCSYASDCADCNTRKGFCADDPTCQIADGVCSDGAFLTGHYDSNGGGQESYGGGQESYGGGQESYGGGQESVLSGAASYDTQTDPFDAFCLYGGDCADCGVRQSLCMNNCGKTSGTEASDGYCDDG
jgi:hypothetical protein